MKKITLLGATGSIGSNTLAVVAAYPDKFKVVALSFYDNLSKGRQIIKDVKPLYVAVKSAKEALIFSREFPEITFGYGVKGLIEASTLSETEIIVTALVGSVGLEPTLAGIEAGKDIALANKETLVMGGELVMAAVARHKVQLLPVDSEHSAIFHCLEGQRRENVDSLLITASGGSFRDLSREDLKHVTVKAALQHPNWSMGAKITIDSATMMNKGLEVIEARWLFDMNYDKIKVVLHRESLVHSLVQFKDGSYLAQLGPNDMRGAIQGALTYPDRIAIKKPQGFDLGQIGQLTFSEMDYQRYPLMALAYEVGAAGGTLPTVYNGANEVAVASFLQGQISYLEIETYVQQAVQDIPAEKVTSLEQLNAVDQKVRDYVLGMIKKGECK